MNVKKHYEKLIVCFYVVFLTYSIYEWNQRIKQDLVLKHLSLRKGKYYIFYTLGTFVLPVSLLPVNSHRNYE